MRINVNNYLVDSIEKVKPVDRVGLFSFNTTKTKLNINLILVYMQTIYQYLIQNLLGIQKQMLIMVTVQLQERLVMIH